MITKTIWPWFVYVMDLDGDDDNDILSALYWNNEIAWFENLSPAPNIGVDPSFKPETLLLYDNYPNPFNPGTNIVFDVIAELMVTLRVFNLRGREVATLIKQRLKPGHYTVPFLAQGLASGTYFYEIRMGTYHAEKKMLLLR